MSLEEQTEKEKQADYIQTVQNYMDSERTELFRVGGMLPVLTKYLLDNSKKSVLYLNKDTFEKLHPVLLDVMTPEKDITLIVTLDVLENEAKKSFEQLPYNTDPSLEKNIPPRLSNFSEQKNIYVSSLIGFPSIILINDTSYIFEDTETKDYPGSFIAGLKALEEKENAEMLDFLNKFTTVALKMYSKPFVNNQPKQIASQNKTRRFTQPQQHTI